MGVKRPISHFARQVFYEFEIGRFTFHTRLSGNGSGFTFVVNSWTPNAFILRIIAFPDLLDTAVIRATAPVRLNFKSAYHRCQKVEAEVKIPTVVPSQELVSHSPLRRLKIPGLR